MPLADTSVIDRPGWWQIVTPSLTQGGMNEVACTELPDDTCDAIIDETIASYRRLGLIFSPWFGLVTMALQQDGTGSQPGGSGLSPWHASRMVRGAICQDLLGFSTIWGRSRMSNYVNYPL